GKAQSAIAPASVIAIESTAAKIGRSMKKRENTAVGSLSSSGSFTGRESGAELVRDWDRTGATAARGWARVKAWRPGRSRMDPCLEFVLIGGPPAVWSGNTAVPVGASARPAGPAPFSPAELEDVITAAELWRSPGREAGPGTWGFGPASAATEGFET